ncbi:MAG: TolC family protein [Verrucomicrobia bacterium]|nr:TolC family protein [Verrucomicrobiota bacterium]
MEWSVCCGYCPFFLSAGLEFRSGQLEALIREAYANNPEMRAAWYRAQAMDERVIQQGALPDPEIRYGYFIQRMDTRQRIGISQMLPGLGKRGLRKEVAVGEARGAEYELELLATQIRAGILRSYTEHLSVIRSVNYLRKNARLLEDLHEVAERRFQSGTASRADLLRLKMEAASNAVEIENMQDRVNATRAALNAQLGREVEAELELQDLSLEWNYSEVRLNEARSRLRAHPEVLRRANEVRIASDKRELANRESRPDLMVGGGVHGQPGDGAG